jgi:hypothetical protein
MAGVEIETCAAIGFSMAERFAPMGDSISAGGELAVGGCAQLTGAPPPPAIGKVPTTTGSVTVRDAGGVVAQVEVGDSACRHDVIETGADGAVRRHLHRWHRVQAFVRTSAWH